MSLEGEERCGINSQTCVMMTGGLFSCLSLNPNHLLLLPPPAHFIEGTEGEALLQIAGVALLRPLKVPPVYLSLLFGEGGDGWGISSPEISGQ